MTDKEWRHIAQTILENQYLMLRFMEKHKDGMDEDFMEMMEKMLKRTEIDIMLVV